MKKTRFSLTQWSTDMFGNIFQEIITLEEVIKFTEIYFEKEPTSVNKAKMLKAYAKLNLQLRREEGIRRKNRF